jgi:hypothetical protein
MPMKLKLCRVKPAEDEKDNAWLINEQESKICVKEHFGRTSAGASNGFRYGASQHTY